MIFYFSGTGNSHYIAKNIAQHNKEELVSIAMATNKINEYTLSDNEIIGFVFPIYAWGPPRPVIEFINNLKLSNYKGNYVFSIATCGENIGNAMKVLEKTLRKKGIHLNSGYSISMPNNYIIMGDVDSKEIEKEKLLAAEETLKSVNRGIERRVKGEFITQKGSLPGLLTGIINPLFNKGTSNTKKFYANDNCTSCGICEKVCNCHNIKVDGKPLWGKQCTQCMACINYCPTKAIQYGKGTEKKGRYTNPNIRLSEVLKKELPLT